MNFHKVQRHRDDLQPGTRTAALQRQVIKLLIIKIEWPSTYHSFPCFSLGWVLLAVVVVHGCIAVAVAVAVVGGRENKQRHLCKMCDATNVSASQGCEIQNCIRRQARSRKTSCSVGSSVELAPRVRGHLGYTSHLSVATLITASI